MKSIKEMVPVHTAVNGQGELEIWFSSGRRLVGEQTRLTNFFVKWPWLLSLLMTWFLPGTREVRGVKIFGQHFKGRYRVAFEWVDDKGITQVLRDMDKVRQVERMLAEQSVASDQSGVIHYPVCL